MTHLTSYSLVQRRRLSAHAHAGCLGTYVHVGRTHCPVHVLGFNTHPRVRGSNALARVRGFNAPVGLLPFKLSSLPIQYSTSLTAFDSTLHIRPPPRHPAHSLDTPPVMSAPTSPVCGSIPFGACLRDLEFRSKLHCHLAIMDIMHKLSWYYCWLVVVVVCIVLLVVL